MIVNKKDKKYLEELFTLENQIFDNSAYSRKEMEEILKNERYEIYLFIEKEIKGYAIIHDSYDIYEIMKIGTKPEERNNEIGSKILKVIKEEVSKSIFLEVRENNKIAKKFYEKNGFLEYGKRKKYYKDGENAILMKYDKEI